MKELEDYIKTKIKTKISCDIVNYFKNTKSIYHEIIYNFKHTKIINFVEIDSKTLTKVYSIEYDRDIYIVNEYDINKKRILYKEQILYFNFPNFEKKLREKKLKRVCENDKL